MHLLLTRPEPDAGRAAQALQALGYTVTISPLMRFRPLLDVRLPKRRYQAVLMARRAGFDKAQSAGGSVDELVALVESSCRTDAGPLIYLAGKARIGDLEGRLEAVGYSVDVRVVYDMEDAGGLSEAAIDALRSGEIDGVLIYSQRSAAAFALALRVAGLAPLSGVHAFCLSEAAAQPLATVIDGPVHVAEKPDQVHLFATVDTVFRA
jgi:uroporphyrinogen-III synthase